MVRGKDEIIIKILETAKEPKIITHIMQASNTNSATYKRYVNALEQAMFIENRGSDKKPEYVSTMKGVEWLKSLKQSSKGLEEFNKYW